VDVADWALLAAAVFWAVLVVALCLAIVGVLRLLRQTTDLVEGVTDQTVALLGTLNETVTGVNVELARVDTIVAGVQSITHSTDQIVGVVHATISNPLIKVAAFAVGAGRTVKQLRGDQ
jgi:uncharacterized protein YoxC